jgi:hypothetical protein
VIERWLVLELKYEVCLNLKECQYCLISSCQNHSENNIREKILLNPGGPESALSSQVGPLAPVHTYVNQARQNDTETPEPISEEISSFTKDLYLSRYGR